MNDSLKAAPGRSMSQLEEMDIRPGKINRNLPVPQLIEIAIQKGEGTLSSSGGLSVKTGKFTGRSPDDRYIVDDETTHDKIDWGKINHPISVSNFDKIFNRMKKHVQGKEFYVFDGFVGADPAARLAIRVINDKAWHSLFANQIFIRPTQKELKDHEPEFTLLSVNDFGAMPETEGTRAETFIILNFNKRIILIGST
ncbi:MAG TPA: phosphoenolpyruvate carboxykinase (ATP), partial [Nitrososphaeraceae archaeon]|nr:phosphoenolpyruvate carboxykinase (ATP) [Nitrososphaeraceae archaeon]